MKTCFFQLAAATLLTACVATAQAPRQQLPPKYLLEMKKATVDDALFQIAHGGKVNIIADATDWPDPAQTKTITTTHSDSTVGWLFGVANEFNLTVNEVGLNPILQLPAESKNYVLWREPDIEPILQQARRHTLPTVREQPGIAPLQRPAGMSNEDWNFRLMEMQREQAGQDVAAWLKERGVNLQKVRSFLSFPSEQLPKPLRDTLRELGRASSSNPFGGINGVKTTVLRQLEDDAWKEARLRYSYDPRERYGTFYIEIHVDGAPQSIGLQNFVEQERAAQ